MKKISIALISIMCILSFASCEKKEVVNNEDSDYKYSITYNPPNSQSITIESDSYSSINSDNNRSDYKIIIKDIDSELVSFYVKNIKDRDTNYPIIAENKVYNDYVVQYKGNDFTAYIYNNAGNFSITNEINWCELLFNNDNATIYLESADMSKCGTTDEILWVLSHVNFELDINE